MVSDSGKGTERTKPFASLNSLKGQSKGQSLERLGYRNENLSPEEPTSAKGPPWCLCVDDTEQQKLRPIQRGRQASL